MKELKEKIELAIKELETLYTEVIQKEKELEKIEKAKWKDKLVQPDEESYYYIGVVSHCFTIYNGELTSRKPEHAFKTKEQAELVKEKMLLMQEMLAFAHVRNDGATFDWSNEKAKYGIRSIDNYLSIDTVFKHNTLLFGIAVKSEEIAREMLEIFGERIKKYYNEQY